MMNTCLKVGPFPEEINREQKELLLKHFGAYNIIHIKKRRKEVFVYAEFNSPDNCKYVMQRLHQRKIMNCILNATYYNKKNTNVNSLQSIDNSVGKITKHNDCILSDINSMLGLSFPISPNLKYSYPPPNNKVLTNINYAIVSVPKFYTQVIHLMNKMNLPPPFGDIPAINSQYKEILSFHNTIGKKDSSTQTDDYQNYSKAEKSSSESEIESDEEIKAYYAKNMSKRLAKQPKPIKKPKLEQLKKSFEKEQRINAIPVKEVFESLNMKQNKLELKITCKTDLLVHKYTTKISETSLEESGFGKLLPIENPEDNSSKSEYINIEDINQNKVSESDWPIIPVFKNYKPGDPSPKLYVKNVSKLVNEQDLKYLFGRYVNWLFQEESDQFSIKLLKEGRMKGQAFISFHSINCATKALNELNGYILKDKPMVISFSRSKPS